MQKEFDVFLEKLDHSVDESDIKGVLDTIFSRFGFGKFAYVSIPVDRCGSPRLISNYPVSWTSRYFEQKYEYIDPVIARAQVDSGPFLWDVNFATSSPVQKVCRLFDEASEYGIKYGITIPVNDRRCFVAAMTLASEFPFSTLYRRKQDFSLALQLITTCFHRKARKIFNNNCVVDGVFLTKREFECLQWAAKGKSAWEIGQILGITRRTAAFHLDNARQKLGVRTIAQAVVRLASSYPSMR